MIQLNLLPNVKLEYVKAQRTRRLVLSVSAIITICAIAIFLLTYSVDLLQKKHLSDLNKQINSGISEIQSKPNIDKILTVQNQLNSLTSLQTSKPAADNLFNYLNELTPSSDNIASLNIDFTQQTLTLTGTATSLQSVNQYIDTLKLTTYYTSSSGSSSQSKAFSNVVLSSFADDTTASNPYPASYTITLNFDPELFDNTKTVTLVVPNVSTTRLEQLQPTNLFQAPVTQSSNGGSQ